MKIKLFLTAALFATLLIPARSQAQGTVRERKKARNKVGKRAAPSAQLLEARFVRRPEQSEVFLGSMIALASANTSSVSISFHIATAKNSVSVQYCPNVASLTTMPLLSITHPAIATRM
jgi:hypothetical protein